MIYLINYDAIFTWDGKRISYYDPVRKQYRHWSRRGCSKLWKNIDYFHDICKGNKIYLANLTILMNNVDMDNAVCYRKGELLLPINSESQLMELLEIKKRTWVEFKKFLNDNHVLIGTDIKTDSMTYHRFYVNPLYTMGYGISIHCYRLFREYLIPHLTDRAIKNLDKHLLEEYSIGGIK